MSFLIHGLPPKQFEHLFSMSDEELPMHRARKIIADTKPGFPCRVSLEDAEPGETIILGNFEHLPENSPFNARHAIYIRENARQVEPGIDVVPSMFDTRLISVRAFDHQHLLVDADVIEGSRLIDQIPILLGKSRTEYIHLHNARPGCFLALVTRS